MGRMHPAHRAPPGAGPDPGLLRGRARSLAGHAGRGKAPAASYRPRRDRPCRRRRPRYLQPLSRRRSAPATRQTTPRQQHAPVAPAGASRAVKPPKGAEHRTAYDMIAPSFVISGKVQELSPGNWETTLPRDVPEFSGDLLVLIATGT